jgi:hypothetical protein
VLTTNHTSFSFICKAHWEWSFFDPSSPNLHKIRGDALMPHQQYSFVFFKTKLRPQNFFACRWHATYRWEALDYNFASNLISIEGLHTKLWAPKLQESQLWELDSHLGVPGQNGIWVLVMWQSIEYIIKGNVVASSKSGLWWVLWVCVCPWFICAPKCSNYALTNLLFGLCKFVWVIDVLVNLPSPIPELQHALLPPKCCEPRSMP